MLNELPPRSESIKESYIPVGAARSKTGLYVASFVVNQYSSEIISIDVLYAANAKKEPAALLPKFTEESATPTGSRISVAKLLDVVNELYPDILPEDVLKHYGHNQRPDGKLGESVLYSSRGNLDSEYLELAKDPEGNLIELDEMVRDAAEKAGFVYKRNTRRKHTPANAVPWQMFVKGIDNELDNYGDYTYVTSNVDFCIRHLRSISPLAISFFIESGKNGAIIGVVIYFQFQNGRMNFMGRRFDTLAFPGGCLRCFTLSYDDGVIQDRHLAELFRHYGLKCSFNLNSALLGASDIWPNYNGKPLDVSKIQPEELQSVYATHEICGHGLYHSSLESIGAPLAMYEIVEDKRRLEALAGKPLNVFAYPYGRFDSRVVEQLRLAGYQGARTVNATHDFQIPENFLTWNPTCHHADPMLMELAKRFVDDGEDNAAKTTPKLFYVWGHAYELDGDGNWAVMDELAMFLYQHREKIWFATNGEIIDYITAYRRLETSTDGSFLHNPSALDVTIRTNGSFVTIPAGQTVAIRE